MADPQSWDEVMGVEKPATPSWDDVMAQKPVEGGLLASAKQMVGSTIKGAGQVAADFVPGVSTDNPVSRYGQSVVDANPTAVNSLSDIADRPLTAVSEAVGNAGGSVAGMVGVRLAGQAITAASPLAGPAAPAVAIAGQLISWLGPAAIAALPSYSGIRDKQLINNPEAQEDGLQKAKAAIGAAAVGAIEVRFGPQNWAMLAFSKEGRAELAKKFAAKSLTGAVTKGALKGAAIEGSEEIAQNPIEQLASGDDPLTEASVKDTLFGGAMGAIGGGVFGGGEGAIHRLTESPKVPKPVLEAADVDSAIEAFKFEVTGNADHAQTLTELRRTYKDHAPEETAAHQADLEAALHSDPTFAPDDEGKPTAYGAPLRALAPQDLPSEGEGLTRDAYEAIAAINQASGLKTIVYQDHANLPDGLVNQPDRVFVSSKTSIDPVVVAAHEAQHLSEEGEPQAAYAKIVQEELTEKAVALATERHGELAAPKLHAEIRADITGDAWADPTFHGRVIEKMREQLGEKAAETNATSFLESIKNLIERIKQTLTGTTFTSPDGQRLATQYVTNLERVHDALAAAIADHFIQKGYRPPGASTNTSQVLVARAIEQQAQRVAAEAVPAFQRTAEQKIRAGAAPLAAPIGSSPELVSALSAAAKAPFDRTTEERLNLEAIRIGVRMSPKNSTVYWHGSPSGDLRGGAYGLHVGTREAAKQALEARIGIPAEGEWDGTREYGKTLLKPAQGGTGYSADGPDVEHYPTGKAKYSDGSPVSLTSKPNILPFRVIGEMTNSPQAPHEDFKANALMRGQITRGTAKRGFYYKQVGEDEGSISAVVPSAEHLQLVKKDDVQQSPKSERAKLEAARSGVVVNIGLNVGDKKSVSDKQALAALKLAGVKVLSSSVQQSDTEATLVATLDRALTPAQAHTVATNLKQEAIAQLDKGKGELYGPKADAWRPFNPEHFLTPDGKRLAAKRAPATTDKRTGVALTKQMRDSSLDTILYGDRSPYGVATQVELAEMLQDLATTHEPARVEDTPENREFVARVLEHEARLALAQDENAVGWYGKTTDAAIRIAGLIYPEIATDADARFAFTYALAVTSNGATIKENVQNAFTIYKSYVKSGRMPDIGFGVRRANMQIAFRVWNERVKKTGLPAFREFMLSMHDVRDLQKINPAIKEVRDARVYGGTVIGPKIGGAFLQNLNGNHDALAMDRWFMRTWGRITGDMVGEKQGAKVTKDAPANANQRQYIRGTMSMALARLQKDHPRLTMSDLQAVLWYPEKLLYTMHGVNDASGMPTDYAIEAAAYAKLKGVDSAKIQAARVQPDEPAGRVAAGEDGQPGLGREAAFSPKAGERRRDAGAGEGARDTRDEPRGADQQGRTPEGWSREVGPQTPSYEYNPRGGKSPTALVGIHYGDRAGLSELDPNKFGSGTRAEERSRISSFTPHLERRVYFYAQKADGKLPQGEGIVTGGHAYRVLATNLYDTYEDPDGVIAQWVKEGRPNGMSGLESGILASGYDGYFNRSHTADGAFVIIGPTKGVPVEYLGTRAQAAEKLQFSPKKSYPDGTTFTVREHGTKSSYVVFSTSDVEEARTKLRFLVGQDPEGRYSVEVQEPKAANASQKEYDATHGQRSAGPELQADEELQRTVGGGRPAQGWARATRIRGADGKPLALHRGAATPLSGRSFELARLGYASENPSSGVGVWFTVSASEAATYGKSESFFLDIRNPRVYKVEDLPGFDSVEAAHAWREGLRAEGHDGLIVSAKHLGGRVHVVAFDASQVVRPERAQFSPKTPEFKKWFGDSKVVDAKGEPLVVYHGTFSTFDAFDTSEGTTEGATFFTPDPAIASKFADPEELGQDPEDVEPNVVPAYLAIKNPLVLDAKEVMGSTKYVSQGGNEFLSHSFEKMRAAVKRARAARNDGLILKNVPDGDGVSDQYAAFEPNQIKSVFNPKPDDSAQFSPKIVGDSKRPYTSAQRSFFERTGRTIEKPTLVQRLANMRKDLGKKMAQGLVDQFAPLKALSPMAYMLARLSKGSAGALEALLHHGKLRLNAGAFDADRSGGFIEKVGIPLKGELEDFLWWVAANRAEMLTAQDRERLFSRADIDAGKTLANGNLGFDYTLASGQRTRVRALAYADAAKNFDAFNKNALDIAEQSGLIDPQSRKIWEHEFYVPFYRVSDEDGGFIGGQIGNALVRQRAFKHLKGGEQKLNSDLLANTISNWAHLIDASAKNRAAKSALEAAANMGVAVEADAATIASMGSSINKNGVWFVDGGVKRHFLVDDPFVLTAITSLEYSGMRGPLMDAMSTMKHALTVGVTASPFFKVKNLIRDSLQAIATAPIGANPITNTIEGFQASNHSTQTYVSALASGGLIRFGTMLEGRMSDRVRQLVKAGVKDTSILNSDSKLQAMYDRFIDPAVAAYNELGNRSEEITRAALYKQLTDKGMDHAQASLMARDLMDFSLQGSWSGIRFLTQVVPFMNARMQGLYKLGRAAKEDPRRFAAVIGATAMFSIALLAAYSDDDDWKKREDWDRDNFWWLKIAGHAFRIPKPFEIGAMASLAERGLEYFISPEMTGERFRKVTLALLANNLSMNPTPQLVKPLIDLYANKDSFTDRPIETLGMEKLAPDYRFTSRTSMLARVAGTAGQKVASVVGADFISPVKIDHALQGYFGWLGSFIVGTSELVARPLTNQATHPAGDLWKLSTGGLIAELPTDQSRYVSHLYEQATVIEQAYGTYRSLLKEGKGAEAREFLEDNRDKIMKYQGVERVKRAEAQLNERTRLIERSALDPEAKKIAIAAIAAQKDRIARLVK